MRVWPWPRPRLLAIVESYRSQVTPLALPAPSSVSGTRTWRAPRYSRDTRRAASWAGGTVYRQKSEIGAKFQEQDESSLLEHLPQMKAPGGDHLVPSWPSTIPAVPREAASKVRRDGRPRKGSRSLPSPDASASTPSPSSVGPVSSFGACASLEARGALVFSEQVLTSLPAFSDLHPALFWGAEQCCWGRGGESCFPGRGDKIPEIPSLPISRGHRIEGWMFWPHGPVVASIYSCVLTSLLSPKRRVPHMSVTSGIVSHPPCPRLWYYFWPQVSTSSIHQGG